MTKTDTDTTATDLAVSTSAVEEFNNYIESLPDSNPEDVQERILRAILTATTADDIVNAGAATKAEEISGVPIRVLGISRADSTFADAGGKYYLHVDCEIVASGDKITVATGSQDICVKLVRLHQLSLLPITCTFEKAVKATQNGYFPLFMRAAPAPF